MTARPSLLTVAAFALTAATGTPVQAADTNYQAVLEELQSMKARISQLETQLKEAKKAQAAADQARREAEKARREAQAARKQAEETAKSYKAWTAGSLPPSQPMQAPSASADEEQVAQTAVPEKKKKKKSKDTLKIGGALWLNYAYKDWSQSSRDLGGDANFDLFRLSVDGKKGDLGISAQYRWYSYMNVIHHGYVYYDFAPKWQGQVGITQVPFGLLPYASHSYWFGLPYYFGLEDDYDLGAKFIWDSQPFNVQLAYFKNSEYADSYNLDRYSWDVVSPSARCEPGNYSQCNQENNQFNVRVAYTLQQGADWKTELGFSGEYGQLYNHYTRGKGDHWAAAAHINSFYGPWNFQLEGGRYELNPNNPAGFNPDYTTLGAFGSAEDVANRAYFLVANIARDFHVNWGPITKLTCYNDYSHLFKDNSSYKDSELNTTGCGVTAGPTYTYVDFILGKNATFLNDPGTGLAAGATNQWEPRFNINFEYYF
jgi:hypothetical protein